jgi:hypothetical protein
MFTIQRVPGDGHCFFHAVIHHLKGKEIIASVKSKLSVSYLRKLTIKSIKRLYQNPIEKSFIDFYIEKHDNLDDYLSDLNSSLWAGPLEIYALSKALRIRIQVFNYSDLKRIKSLKKNGKRIYKITEQPIIDFGDKRRTPVTVVIYGFNFDENDSGCHYNALNSI